jgi:glutamyl-tRNA synthetase
VRDRETRILAHRGLPSSAVTTYRGRLAPTPTGELHLGHARTFHSAWRRAMEANGGLVLRIEDLDALRCHTEYVQQMLDDFAWMGITWTEGPFYQSARTEVYVEAWRRLRDAGVIYPSRVSRKEARDAAHAPHDDEEGSEPIFPPALRTPPGAARGHDEPWGVTWRFRVPDGDVIRFDDRRTGAQAFTAGTDFGDFVVWRADGVPAYELAVVADDIAMGITEVVRGEDLLRSTARQLLIYRSLGAQPPAWCHEPLVRDAEGRRLAKRFHALSLRTLRERGVPWAALRDATHEALATLASSVGPGEG